VSYAGIVKERRRQILHVDLDPFFVSVERSLDPTLRGKPVIVGGEAGPLGLVAAASAEAREAGVRPGQSLVQARRLCPDGVFRPGDLETYGRVSDDVTAILLAASRRVERPSADEAYVDLTPESPSAPNAVAATEVIKDEIQRRLGLDASLGLATTRLAARVASSFAKPRGFLLLLPGYEASFLGRQPLSALHDLPPHLLGALERAGFETLGDVASADQATLAAVVGVAAAPRLSEAARNERDEPIAVSAPPLWIQEEATIRDRRSDRAALEGVAEGLATRAALRLRPFGLAAEQLTVEVRRADASADRRSDSHRPPLVEPEDVAVAVHALAEPLLDPAPGVRALQVRLGRLVPRDAQAVLFPEATPSSRR
jgi:DNA polymerase-4